MFKVFVVLYVTQSILLASIERRVPYFRYQTDVALHIVHLMSRMLSSIPKHLF